MLGRARWPRPRVAPRSSATPRGERPSRGCWLGSGDTLREVRLAAWTNLGADRRARKRSIRGARKLPPLERRRQQIPRSRHRAPMGQGDRGMLRCLGASDDPRPDHRPEPAGFAEVAVKLNGGPYRFPADPLRPFSPCCIVTSTQLPPSAPRAASPSPRVRPSAGHRPASRARPSREGAAFPARTRRSGRTSPRSSSSCRVPLPRSRNSERVERGCLATQLVITSDRRAGAARPARRFLRLGSSARIRASTAALKARWREGRTRATMLWTDSLIASVMD